MAETKSSSTRDTVASSSSTLIPSDATSRPTVTIPTVINCKKALLVSRGYKDFADWVSRPGHIYVGRDMQRYVPGAVGSKWGNPFKESSGMSLEERIAAYEAYVKSTPSLAASLSELLNAKEIGCWCDPSPCHGHALVKMLRELAAGDVVPLCGGGVDGEATQKKDKDTLLTALSAKDDSTAAAETPSGSEPQKQSQSKRAKKNRLQ